MTWENAMRPKYSSSGYKSDSLKSRSDAYKETYKTTKDHKAAGAAYAAGNKWAEENHRALNS